LGREKSLQFYIFWTHFQAFVLVLPNDRRVKIQEFGDDLLARFDEQLLRFIRRLVELPIVIASPFALHIVPMRHGMNRRVLFRPWPYKFLQLHRELVEGYARFPAMLA